MNVTRGNMSDHHLFVECPGSNKLVMFFTATGAKPGLFNWWAVGHQLAESANVLFVNGWSNTWYQDGVKGLGDGLEETLDTIRTWCDEHGVDELYCTGQSMGGYGALLFSALLPARVMAFGAEAILGLPHSQWERKANKTIALLHRDLTDPEKYSFEGCLFAGERDPLDILCASKMAAHRSLRIITMRGVGHGPAGHLKNRDRLLPMLQAWIDGKELPPVKEAGRALETESFPQDFYDAWVFGREKQWQQSQDSACRAAAAYPMSDEAFLLKGNALMQLGARAGGLRSFRGLLLPAQPPAAAGTHGTCAAAAGRAAGGTRSLYQDLAALAEPCTGVFRAGLGRTQTRPSRGGAGRAAQGLHNRPQEHPLPELAETALLRATCLTSGSNLRPAPRSRNLQDSVRPPRPLQYGRGRSPVP